MPKTRSEVICAIFGAPSDLRDNILPTYYSVMKYYLYTRDKLKYENNNRDPSVSEIARELVIKLKDIWIKASIPIVSDQQIIHLIKEYHKKYRSLKKNIKSNYNRRCLEKIESFKSLAERKLFDIAFCKCKDFKLCQCANKIPEMERVFLADQRAARKMRISGVDVQTTISMQKTVERKGKEKERLEKQREKVKAIDFGNKRRQIETENTSSESETENFDNINSEMGLKIDLDYSEGKNVANASVAGIQPMKQTRMQLSNVAQACDRTGVSDRAAAILVSAAFKDMGVITKSDTSCVIDRSKVRRERKKRRSEVKASADKLIVEGLYFDGRKDKTLIQEKIGTKYYRKICVEEHCALVSEPGSTYLGHTTPTGGNAHSISVSILRYLKNLLGDNLAEIVAVGCDGTVVNTGSKNGVLRKLELNLGKPLQWFICLFHTNELPLRHLIHYLDGKTNDPQRFTGIIGKALEYCERSPIVAFKKIPTTLPKLDLKELSTDQRYLYEMVEAIGKGDVPPSLAIRNPGKMAHSRWLTTANRILRLYVATTDASSNLQILTEYVVKVYAVTWFQIKSQPSCTEGAKHLFEIIKLSRFLPENLRDIVNPVIQRNGYFSHPENVLLAMLTDSRSHVRELGLRRILKCRSDQSHGNGKAIREFKIPKLNFHATDYIELINWQSITYAEPPLTIRISDDELKSMVKSVPTEIRIAKFPCHTQAVERCVKLVTEASAAVCSDEARDGFIKARVESRRQLPQFETKSDFVKCLEI